MRRRYEPRPRHAEQYLRGAKTAYGAKHGAPGAFHSWNTKNTGGAWSATISLGLRGLRLRGIPNRICLIGRVRPTANFRTLVERAPAEFMLTERLLPHLVLAAYGYQASDIHQDDTLSCALPADKIRRLLSRPVST